MEIKILGIHKFGKFKTYLGVSFRKVQIFLNSKFLGGHHFGKVKTLGRSK